MAGPPCGKRESPSVERYDFGSKRISASNNGSKSGRIVYIRKVKLNRDPRTPFVVVTSKNLKEETEFLVDTESEHNILKICMAHDYLMCNKSDKIKLNGITKETVTTYGSCFDDIYEYPMEFHIVPNSFPIPHDDIIGPNFFKDAAKLNFIEEHVEWHEMTMFFVKPREITIPARTSNVVKILQARKIKRAMCPH